MRFQRHPDAHFTREFGPDFDDVATKNNAQYPPLIPSKPFLTFAERFHKQQARGRERDPYRSVVFPGRRREPLPEKFNPNPQVYELTGPDERRRAKIELLGFDEPSLEPLPDPSGVESRDLDDLLRGGWRPARLEFSKKWPAGGEVETGWYKMVFVHWHLRMVSFVEKYFGLGNIWSESERGKLWKEAGLGEAFLHYAQLVARQANDDGGWEVLLGENRRRLALVTGVIARLIQTEVFDEYLFGASETARKMFKLQDSATIANEGYSRTDTRASAVRLILRSETLTENFWDHVDSLAFQLTEILLPLMTLMDKKTGQGSQANSLRAMYQDLHHIVSEAGYLSIGIRWSHDIFRFTWPVPGQPWELDHDNADEDNGIFSETKVSIEKAEEKAKQRWRRGKAKKGGDRTASSTVSRPTMWILFFGSRSRSRSRAEPATREDKPHVTPSYLAKVHIALLPTLQRFTTSAEDGRLLHYSVATGEAIDTIQKTRVIYYLGRAEDRYDSFESEPSLETWIGASPTGKALTRFASGVTSTSLAGSVWAWDQGLLAILLGVFGISVGLYLAWDALEGLSLGDYRFFQTIKSYGNQIAVWCLDIAIFIVRLLTAVKNAFYLAARLTRFFLIWILAGGPFNQEGRDAARDWFPSITWNAPQSQTFTSGL